MDISLLKDGDRELLRQSFLFSGTEEDFIRQAASDCGCQLMSFPRGADIFTPAAFSRSVGIVLTGRVQVSKLDHGRRLVMNVLERGSLFGAAALFNQREEYVTTLSALARCRVAFFSQALLETLMRKNFTVALNYIRFLSGRICYLNNEIQGLISVSAEAALSRYLLERGGELTVDSFSGLAQRLNIGRASLYRAIDTLTERGLLAKEGKTLTALDADGLAAVK